MKVTFLKPGLSAFFLIILIYTSGYSQKLRAEDVVAKHLDSIAAKNERAGIKNQLILTDLKFSAKGSTNPIIGKAVILSENNKNLWGMSLTSNDYPQDRFGYNGKSSKVAYVRPAVRSLIGDFIYSNNELLKEGLLGGTLSTSWALLNVDSRKAKLSYDGTKTIAGKENHVLSYSVKGGSDLNIKMYFDSENFQHTRTEYNRVIGATQGSNVDSSASQGEDRYRLVEDFSNYIKMGNMMLPSVYKISYSYSSSTSIRTKGKENREVEWTFNVTSFAYNRELDEDSFDIDAK